MLSGISIGDADLPPLPYDERWREKALVYNLFPHLDATEDNFQSATAIRVSSLGAAIESILQHYTSDFDLELARLFLFYLMGNVFFSNSSSSVNVGFLEAVSSVDFDTPIVYDWGTPILAYLYSSLDRQCVVSTTQRSLCGFWQLLEYWYYEYFHNFSFVTNTADSSSFFPRISFWSGDNRAVRRNEARHIYSVADNQMALRLDRDQIVWHPFQNSVHLDIDFIAISRTLSARRFPLVSVPTALGSYWYLGERCFRQLHDFDVIPDDPHPHTCLGIVYSPEQLEASRGIGWWPVERFIITGLSYTLFWRRYFTSSTDTFLHSAGIDLVGPSALRHGVVPPLVEDVSQPSQGYTAPDHVAAARHFGWTMAVPTSTADDRYVDVFHGPPHDDYPTPTDISYHDLFDLQMGIRHTGYLEHRRSIDYYEDLLRRERESAEAHYRAQAQAAEARHQAELEAERKRFSDFQLYYEQLGGSRDDDERPHPRTRPRTD